VVLICTELIGNNPSCLERVVDVVGRLRTIHIMIKHNLELALLNFLSEDRDLASGHDT
jgi:hypothetical protein